MSFWLHVCCREWEGLMHKPVNHTSWVAVVTPIDRPKSVHNRYVIVCGVVCVVTLPFWHVCWCRGFCHRTEPDLFLFSLCTYSIWILLIGMNMKLYLISKYILNKSKNKKVLWRMKAPVPICISCLFFILNKKRKVSFWWCNLSQFSLKVSIWDMKYC